MGRNYSSVAGVMLLQGQITETQTSIVVDTTAGLPPVPYVIVIDYGLASEEAILITAQVGTSLTADATIGRGFSGTIPAQHASGAQVRHMAVSVDFQEAGDHISASADVHGLENGAQVVGTTQTQSLTDKTIDGDLNTLLNIDGGSLKDGTVPGAKLDNDVDAATLNGRTLFVQSATPTANAVNDLWVAI